MHKFPHDEFKAYMADLYLKRADFSENTLKTLCPVHEAVKYTIIKEKVLVSANNTRAYFFLTKLSPSLMWYLRFWQLQNEK